MATVLFIVEKKSFLVLVAIKIEQKDRLGRTM